MNGTGNFLWLDFFLYKLIFFYLKRLGILYEWFIWVSHRSLILVFLSFFFFPPLFYF